MIPPPLCLMSASDRQLFSFCPIILAEFKLIYSDSLRKTVHPAQQTQQRAQRADFNPQTQNHRDPLDPLPMFQYQIQQDSPRGPKSTPWSVGKSEISPVYLLKNNFNIWIETPAHGFPKIHLIMWPGSNESCSLQQSEKHFLFPFFFYNESFPTKSRIHHMWRICLKMFVWAKVSRRETIFREKRQNQNINLMFLLMSFSPKHPLQ